MQKYEQLNYNGKEQGYDTRSLELIDAMCAVYDGEHRVLICHPNKVFKNQPINEKNKDITNQDWYSVDTDLIFKDEKISEQMKGEWTNDVPWCKIVSCAQMKS